MASYKADHLKAMIREVVRQEIKEVVSGVIAEVLSERYLRQLAETAARPRGVASLPIQGDDEVEEETPSILSNTILGVGQENPVFKKEPKDDGVRQFGEDARNEMLSLFFEGTRPLASQEADAGLTSDWYDDNSHGRGPRDYSSGMNESVALRAPPPLPEASKYKAILEAANKRAADKGPMSIQKDLASEEARLKKLREDLDRRPA